MCWERMTDRPPLSVVITVRRGMHEIVAVLDALLPQADRSGTEVLVVGPVAGPAPDPVRLVRVDNPNIFALRLSGIRAAHGELIAIGEDHALPRPDWCEAVIRAHAERPQVKAIIGCLVNATDRTLSGRGNFLGFAAPVQPPLDSMPLRPPPLSALSLKRAAIDGLGQQLGEFESVLVPRLFAEGAMATDPRVVVDHHQDHGIVWAITNAFHGARSAYGYLSESQSPLERIRQARWSVANWPPRILHEAREAMGDARGTRAELALVAFIGAAVGVGGAVGALTGPGRSPAIVA
jgi:hypothetical protein